MKIKKYKRKQMKEKGSITLLPLREEPSKLFNPQGYDRFSSKRSIEATMAYIRWRELEPTEYEVVNPESLETLGYFTSSAIIEWLMTN